MSQQIVKIPEDVLPATNETAIRFRDLTNSVNQERIAFIMKIQSLEKENDVLSGKLQDLTVEIETLRRAQERLEALANAGALTQVK